MAQKPLLWVEVGAKGLMCAAMYVHSLTQLRVQLLITFLDFLA
jgi:hypothetical protein